MAGSAASSVLPASQPASGLRRSSRSTIKRVFSVDDLEVLQSTDNSLTDKTDKPSGSYIVVNSNRRRKLKQQSSHISSQQSTQSQSITTPSHNDVTVENDVGTAHCNEHAISDKATVSSGKGNVVLTCHEFTAMSEEIRSLKATVTNLRLQLDSVLSFLGIVSDNSIAAHDFPPLTGTHPVQRDINVNSRYATADTANNISHSQQSEQSYANVARKSAAFSAPFRNAVVSAVYADFEEKDRRAKNIVISGLCTSSQSDKVSVENLCNSEFGFTPRIVKCRRLGLPRDGRVQPLLVVLETVNDSEFLIKNARCLRRSADPVIRDSVYINPDLTKAEALTAYHRRCRRRELAAARSATRVQATQPVRHSSITAPEPTHSQGDASNHQLVASDHSNPQSTAVLNTQSPSTVYQPVSTIDLHNTSDDIINLAVTPTPISPPSVDLQERTTNEPNKLSTSVSESGPAGLSCSVNISAIVSTLDAIHSCATSDVGSQEVTAQSISST